MGGLGPHSQFRLPSRLLRRRGARSVGSGGDRRSDGACSGPEIDMPIFGPGNGSVRLWTIVYLSIGRAVVAAFHHGSRAPTHCQKDGKTVVVRKGVFKREEH